MTDHKFADDEIVMLLRAYAEMMCRKCIVKNLGTHCESCFITHVSQAVDLINRQKAELEDLLEIVFMDRSEAIKNLKAEAIKEFAERLKANMSNIARMEYGGNIYFCVGYDLIDNLVKEMTEGKNESQSTKTVE